jgi:hypothetical protein
MNRILLGALSALLLVAVGLFWLQGRAETVTSIPPPDPAALGRKPAPDALPSADVANLHGPKPPEATKLTREQRRFARYDRNSDGRITRNEMMSTRTPQFRELDTDGNNLLTFEEWAISTGDRFKGADRNGDGWLSPEEFATTRPKEKPNPKCGC